MNIDDRFPSEPDIPLSSKELSAVIQPGLRMVAEALALACEAGPETYRDRLRTTQERLAEVSASLERLLTEHNRQTSAHKSERAQALATDSPSPPAKERILYAPHARQHRRQYMKILLVEDNPVSNAITKAMLEQQGWRVSGALSGRDALEKLRVKSAYDLIITDLMMDGMDGLELAREIRKCERNDTNTLAHTREGRPPIPIVAITANDNPAVLGEYLEAGIDEMVVRSTSLDSLIASIERLTDKAGSCLGGPYR